MYVEGSAVCGTNLSLGYYFLLDFKMRFSGYGKLILDKLNYYKRDTGDSLRKK